jgi:hypothetical protein
MLWYHIVSFVASATFLVSIPFIMNMLYKMAKKQSELEKKIEYLSQNRRVA